MFFIQYVVAHLDAIGADSWTIRIATDQSFNLSFVPLTKLAQIRFPCLSFSSTHLEPLQRRRYNIRRHRNHGNNPYFIALTNVLLQPVVMKTPFTVFTNSSGEYVRAIRGAGHRNREIFDVGMSERPNIFFVHEYLKVHECNHSWQR